MRHPATRPRLSLPAATVVVFRKELLDALRDRRTLMMVIISSVLLGPLMMVALSGLIGSLERQAEQREVLVAGLEHAPSLRNFIERQSYTVRAAPGDHEQRIRAGTLHDAVLVVGAGFEAALAEGRAPSAWLVFSSADARAQAAVPRLARLLQGFNSERAVLHLAVRGVAPALLQAVAVQERDLAAPAARGARFTSMIPILLLVAVLYGTLAAALDTTAGERERGSLEPLLTAPVSRVALVVGKWAAVTAVGLAIAVLSVTSFLPAQWLLRSETLQALLRFGPREAALLMALLVPLAAALAAVMMAVAIRCRSFKEAQTNNGLVILAATLLPMLELFNPGGDQRWTLAVPALAQTVLMNRVLRDEAIAGADLLLPLGVCALMVAVAAGLVARSLKQ